MDTLIALHTNGFPGSEYFNHETLDLVGFDSDYPEMYNNTKPMLTDEFGIDAVGVQIPEFTVDILQTTEQQYPEEDVDAVLVQWPKTAYKIHEANIYKNTPLIVAGHTLLLDGIEQEKWLDVINSEREVSVFTGSVRSARAFNKPDYENFEVIIAPIMGRSIREESRLPDVFIEEPQKEYDIGFFSKLRIEKRPHRVLETANNVAKTIGEQLHVWIGGVGMDNVYYDLVERLSNSQHYNHINISFEGELTDRDLFRKVQQTRVMYLPIVNPNETTCYSAWEIVGYDVPLVSTDWAGVGEATRHSRHHVSSVVPVQSVPSFRDVFPDSVKKAYPDMIREIDRRTFKRVESASMTIDEEAAQTALIDVLTTDTKTNRELTIPKRIHTRSTLSAMKDIMNNSLPDPNDTTLNNGVFLDVVNTDNGYPMLRDTYAEKTLYQTSLYFNESETST